MEKHKIGWKDVAIIVLVTVMSIGANLPEEMTTGWGLSRDYLLFGLVALVVVSLVRYLKFTLILVIAILAVGANLPTDLAEEFGVDPHLMMAALVAMVATSFLNVLLKLPKGAKPIVQVNSANGASKLCAAAVNGQAGLVYSLVSAGINPNFKDPQGNLPLVIAAARGNALVVKILLDNGADPALTDGTGTTAVVAAKKNNFDRTAALLIAAEGNMAKNKAGKPGMGTAKTATAA